MNNKEEYYTVGTVNYIFFFKYEILSIIIILHMYKHLIILIYSRYQIIGNE